MQLSKIIIYATHFSLVCTEVIRHLGKEDAHFRPAYDQFQLVVVYMVSTDLFDLPARQCGSHGDEDGQ